jgi:hypothetical protein
MSLQAVRKSKVLKKKNGCFILLKVTEKLTNQRGSFNNYERSIEVAANGKGILISRLTIKMLKHKPGMQLDIEVVIQSAKFETCIFQFTLVSVDNHQRWSPSPIEL